MRLFIVRHGEAAAGANDGERPLTEKGKSDVLKVARFLKEGGATVKAIYHSKRKRAIQTAEIFRQVLNPQAVMNSKTSLSPDDPVDDIVHEIAAWKEDAMLVGHLPFLSHLISALGIGDDSRSIVSMDTGSAVILETADQQKWYITGFIHPALIP